MRSAKSKFKHLIYLIDGTWVWAGSGSNSDVYSNIYYLNMMLRERDADNNIQITHYDRGLGASKWFRKYTEGGFSYGLDEKIADIYINICCNYEKGDKIYLFGFSRGAVICRAVSGLLDWGILKQEHVDRYESLWTAYCAFRNEGSGLNYEGQPTDIEGFINNQDKYFHEKAVKVEFIGLFDTVTGGKGLAEAAQAFNLKRRQLSGNVKNALQLLAIDERRDFFRPILFEGAAGLPMHFEQIWLPGVHSDVGGGYGRTWLSNVALMIMVDRIMSQTLLNFRLDKADGVEEFKRRIINDRHNIAINEEINLFYKVLSTVTERMICDFDSAIHPFAYLICHSDVLYKGNKRTYPLLDRKIDKSNVRMS